MIETQRLLLCRPQNKDMLTIENLWRDKQVRQFLGGTISEDLIKQKIAELQNHWNLQNQPQSLKLIYKSN